MTRAGEENGAFAPLPPPSGRREGTKRPFGSEIGHSEVFFEQADSTKKRRQSYDSDVLIWASGFQQRP